MAIDIIGIRRASERGVTRTVWLTSRHSFSFGEYHDPAHMGFRSLRVINDDVVQPGQGFGTHPHRDMEILSFVVTGELEHRDSLGTGSVIRPGETQRMSAGTGILHSEFNPSREHEVRFLQVWIEPTRRGLAPGYDQRRFEQRPAELVLVASPDGRDGSLTVHQDVLVRRAVLAAAGETAAIIAADRFGWLQLVRGSVTVERLELAEGDGLAARGPGELAVKAGARGADLILFDLA